MKDPQICGKTRSKSGISEMVPSRVWWKSGTLFPRYLGFTGDCAGTRPTLQFKSQNKRSYLFKYNFHLFYG